MRKVQFDPPEEPPPNAKNPNADPKKKAAANVFVTRGGFCLKGGFSVLAGFGVGGAEDVFEV